VPKDEAAAQALVSRHDALELYELAIANVNTTLAQFERIKRFALVPREFTIERGELTPTLKIKRRVVEQTCRMLIEEIYREKVDER
jgi:long-chain acyl-CoA synthetase